MEKKGSNYKKGRDIDSFNSRLDTDEDIKILKIVLNRIKEKYNLSSSEILNIADREDVLIPCSIFIKELSPLEAVVKYLRENLKFENSKIAKLIGRDSKTTWQAYKNASKNYSSAIKPQETKYTIPVSALNTKFSILEAVVAYLKENFNLSYHIIGELLNRNERTIWTVYNRAKKKNEQI